MQNLILIGMPGSGKSTVGVLLAKALGFDFLDTDLLIQRRAGRRLQEILDQDGIDAFLQLEAEVLSSITCQRTVIATGGSAVLEPAAMHWLSGAGRVCYLEAPLETLRQRISNLDSRGIAFGPGQTLDDIYRQRVPLYARWAQDTIPCQNTVAETVAAVLAALPPEFMQIAQN